MGNQKLLTGIGFVLFNHLGEIFTIKELKPKPEYLKEAGMISFPLETQKNSDIGDFATVKRLIKEEMDEKLRSFIYCIAADKTNFTLIPKKPELVVRYQFGFLHEKAPTDIEIIDEDVEFNGWMRPDQLFFANPIRIEVQPILKHLFRAYHNKLSV